MCVPAQANAKSHAVTLRVQSGPRTLQYKMNRQREEWVHRGSKNRRTSTCETMCRSVCKCVQLYICMCACMRACSVYGVLCEKGKEEHGKTEQRKGKKERGTEEGTQEDRSQGREEERRLLDR